MSAPTATTFDQAMSRAPMRTYQWVIVVVCMLVLVCDGIDMQLLGIIAPLVIADFGVDRGTFGIAMSAALIGFGLGAFGGGWLGDRIGRRYALAIAALVFALATVGASLASDVWSMALWRVLGGLGFGSAYANALTMASEWVPDRLRPVTLSTLSVGTPVGGTVVGWLAPIIAADQGWRATFVVLGVATLAMVAVILIALRDSPSFLILRGKREQAQRTARLVVDGEIALSPPSKADGAADGPSIGVLHSSNRRLNIGIGIAFTALALCAYGILNWSTTFLTAAGFTLEQAGRAVAVAGITSMVGSVLAGIFARRFGSRVVLIAISITLVIIMLASAAMVEALPATPSDQDRLVVIALIGAAAAIFSAGIASMYVIMGAGYSQSCRSAGIGFGIFMSRLGAVAASGLGGVLLELGGGSVLPFFGVLAFSATLVAIAAVIIDRHVPPLRAGE
jgi:AAHS family 4-hydroxybenzoate transporter-like MFS transporter